MILRSFRNLCTHRMAPAGALLALLAAPAVAAEASRYVRLPAAEVPAAAELDLHPRQALDYGSFRFLELPSADHARLAASGLAYEEDAGAGQVRVQGYRFDPVVDGEPPLAAQLRSPESAAAGLRLIQLAGPPRDEWLATLAARGLTLLQYYPHYTYLAWATPGVASSAATELDFVRWQGAFHPAYKPHTDLAGRSGTIRNVDVMFFDDGKREATLAALADLGATLLQSYPAQPDRLFYDAIVELPAAAVAEVALLPQVVWLGFESTRPTLDDEMSAQIVAGNYTAGVPFTGYNAWLSAVGLDGTGVIWAIVDTGVDYDHPDLSGHIVGGYDFPGACTYPGEPGTDCPGGGHGTHVAGIVGADATGGFADTSGFLYGLGIAPAYSIYAMNSLSAPSWPPAGGWQEHSKRAILGAAVGGNNSWTTGEGTAHGYQASERTHDLMVRDGNFDTAATAEPLIEVYSAGNSGPGASTLTAPKEAKNLIVVANSLNYRAGSIDALSSSSSRGPAVDGRTVPTVAAPGSTIASTRNDDGGDCSTAIAGTSNLYAFCSGTSMAAPHVSGATVLLTEWWRGFNAGADPSPAMAKALLVNGAVDMGVADVPNFNEGWGRIHLPNVIASGANILYYDQSELFTATGESYALTVGVPDPSKPLKVTVVWSDSAGAAGANPALVNNLDLTVDDGSNLYKGNVFASGWSTTGGAADTLNNLENVFIQTPPGSATITIAAINIAGDGVPYNGDSTDQDFALICFNCALSPDFTLNASPESLDICAPANGNYTVDVGSILGYSDAVDLSASGNPAGTTAVFGTDPIAPGASTVLTIGNTGAGAPGSYTLNVSGSSTSGIHGDDVVFNLFSAAPGTPALTSPANGATGVSPNPTYTWSAATQAGTYAIDIATDASFASIVDSASGLTATSYDSAVTLGTSTQYFWRATATNACGAGSASTTWSFTTQAAPGDCGGGQTPETEFSENFESGAPGWTSSGTGNTWAQSSARVHSGTYSWHADDPAAVSDQRLVSPAMTLPASASPLSLKFWHHQTIEDASGGCFDGAILEVSTDGGTNWTQLDAQILVDPYDGTVDAGYSNPLAGLDAWCGDPQDWTAAIADLDAYAGMSVRFRFRLGSDSSVAREGWYLDDLVVQSCSSLTLIFADGFESGDTSAWSSAVP